MKLTPKSLQFPDPRENAPKSGTTITLKENQRNLSLLRKSREPISHYLIQFYIYESEISYGRYIVMYLYPCVFNIVVRASSFSSCQHYATWSHQSCSWYYSASRKSVPCRPFCHHSRPKSDASSASIYINSTLSCAHNTVWVQILCRDPKISELPLCTAFGLLPLFIA